MTDKTSPCGAKNIHDEENFCLRFANEDEELLEHVHCARDEKLAPILRRKWFQEMLDRPDVKTITIRRLK